MIPSGVPSGGKDFHTWVNFSFWKATLHLGEILLAEYILLQFCGYITGLTPFQVPIILIFVSFGAFTVLFISSEIIRYIQDSVNILIFLFILVLEYIFYFAFQYGFLEAVAPGSFSGLHLSLTNLFFQSTMIFALNPMIVPQNVAAELMLTLNVLGAFAMTMFVFQNIWRFKDE
jgi:hypothetical protein